MRAQPLDHDPLMLEADPGYHPVMIAFDIENDPVIGNYVSASEIGFQGIEIFPFCFPDFLKPGCQISFRIMMNFVKFFQFSETDHIHEIVCIDLNKNKEGELS